MRLESCGGTSGNDLWERAAEWTGSAKGGTRFPVDLPVKACLCLNDQGFGDDGKGAVHPIGKQSRALVEDGMALGPLA